MKYLLVFFLCLFITSTTEAGVRSLGNSGSSSSVFSNGTSQSGNISSAPVVNLNNTNTTIICNNSGFTLQKCPSGYVPVFPCPENNKYFRDCCPKEYRFKAQTCLDRGLEPSVETCLGFHACKAK